MSFVFSVGWRRGYFFDFEPLQFDPPKRRSYDLLSVLGQLYGRLLFQERFSISPEEWAAFFDKGWFPFAALRTETINQMLNYIRSKWNLDELTWRVADEVIAQVDSFVESWQTHAAFAPHIPLLRRGVERFKAGDYMSCISIFFPRLEGILRSYQGIAAPQTSLRKSQLCKTAVESKTDYGGCLLLPHKFRKYLEDIYFASFRPGAADVEISRHSIAHGVANAKDFSAKSATIAILATHQLFLCFALAAADDGRNNGEE